MTVFSQIFDMIDIGLVILDKEFKVRFWNRWLESHSGIDPEKICNTIIYDFYPNLNNPKFLRNFKAVLTFGNFYFFPHKLYEYIFPFKPDSSFETELDSMQQSCTMGPLRDEFNVINYVFISIRDVTEAVVYEKKLTEALFSLLDPDAETKVEPQTVLSDLYHQAPPQASAGESVSFEGQIEALFSMIADQRDKKKGK